MNAGNRVSACFATIRLPIFTGPITARVYVKKGTGIQGECNWDAYIQFMKNQLTEILTNYGPIYGIWFDGHWDQVKQLEQRPERKTITSMEIR